MVVQDIKYHNQIPIILNGNEAVARAILHIGYDGEGYYPITPSSEVGEEVSRAIARGEIDLSFVVGTSELAAIGICCGMALAGGRVVDVTSAQGLLLKVEQMPAMAGLGLPMVLNISTRDVNAPLNIKNGHSDLVATLGFGWLIFLAPNVQTLYDMNIIALKVAEKVDLPAIVAYDGFHTSHGARRIFVFENPEIVREFLGEKPKKPTILDVNHPKTFGPYMNDDLINSKVLIDEKMKKALKIIPEVFREYGDISGRYYPLWEVYGDNDADVGVLALNTAGEALKDAVDILRREGKKTKAVIPFVLRPWFEDVVLKAIGNTPRFVIAERVSQYGAGNYLNNEIGATLQKAGKQTLLINRVYGIGGLNFRASDARNLFELGINWPKVPEKERTLRGYYGAWEGELNYNPPVSLTPLKNEDTTLNKGEERVNLKKLAEMPPRFDKHSACPGCGIFVNLDIFLKGIDGHVVLIFNTGCGMVVTTGYPFTSFKVPYFHNLFHNAASTATGIVEMYKRFRKQGKISEEITFIAVTGDGGDDIGMDQVIGCALRNDPIIVFEYDNKGYMNTGGQLCYTGIKGQKNSNAPVGPARRGKQTHHKDIIEILRGCHGGYLFHAAESNPQDMIRKARKAQETVRKGEFVFGKVFSVCPFNWGSPPEKGREIVDMAVKSCLHPLYEVVNGKTILNYNPEKLGKKVPVSELFKIMGPAFSHLIHPSNADLLEEIQKEVDRRWRRLVEMDANQYL